MSVATSGGEYFQVSFTESDDSDDAYFLPQRQVESYDGGSFYIESHERTLYGHYKISRAELGRSVLRLELASTPPKLSRSDSRPIMLVMMVMIIKSWQLLVPVAVPDRENLIDENQQRVSDRHQSWWLLTSRSGG